MSFEIEAVVLVEILSEIDRMKVKKLNIATTKRKLDLLEEREKATIKMAAYKQRAVQYFN